MKVKAVSLAVLSGVVGMGVEAALLAASAAQWRLVRAPGPASTAEVLTLCAAVAGLLAGAWATLAVLAALLTHVPGRVGRLAGMVAAVWSPVAARRLAALLVGATLAGGVSMSAAGAAPGTGARAIPPAAGQAVPSPPAAAAVPSPPAYGAGSVVPADPGPGWTPPRPQRPPAAISLLTAPEVRRTSPRAMVVHRGDTLWGIVARYLGPEAGDADLVREWPRWYEANRAVIGDDPDRILPGQVLSVPTSAHEVRR